jgi:hypothetical protein
MPNVGVDVGRDEGRDGGVMRRQTQPERPHERARGVGRLVDSRVENPRQRRTARIGPQPTGGVADLRD